METALERQAQLQTMMQEQPPQAPQNPLTAGSIAAMDNIKRAMALDSDQRRQSLGSLIQTFGANFASPVNHKGGTLGAISHSLSPALAAYQEANQQGQTENMKAFEVMQALEKAQEEKRRQTQSERHKTAELEETRRYHDLMGGKSGRGNNPYYGMPALGKHIVMQEEIDAGFQPGSNGKKLLTPEEQEQYSNQNQLAMQKVTTDSQTREKALFVKNIVETIKNTDLDDLTRYSGLGGQAELAKEKVKDALGHPSKEYIDYKKATTASELEAKEMSKFFGASITPAEQHALKVLTNPTGMFTSKEVAKAQVEQARDVLIKQAKTYTSGLKSTAPYAEDKTMAKPPAPNDDVLNKLINAKYSTEEIQELYDNGDLK